MGNDPEWGSPEFNEAIKKHDKKADPKREEKGLNYTKKDDKPKGGKGGGKKG